MVNWLDGVADQFLDGSKSLICGIYKASPTAALAKLAGNAGFAPAAALTTAWNNACGTPDPPAGIQYGDPQHNYDVKLFDGVSGALLDTRLGIQGAIKITQVQFNQTSSTKDTVNVTFRRGLGPSNPAGTQDFVQGQIPLGQRSYTLSITLAGTNTVPPTNGVGYPPLTTQQNTDLQAILDQLAAIRNTQGLQSAALAGLGVSAAANLAATAGVAAAVAAVAEEVAAVAAEVAAVLSLCQAILRLVQLIDQHVGTGTGQGPDSSSFSTVSDGLQAVSEGIRSMLENLGIGNQGYYLQTPPIVRINNLCEGLDVVLSRLGGGEEVDLSEVLQKLEQLLDRLGFVAPSVLRVCGQADQADSVQSFLEFLDLKTGFDEALKLPEALANSAKVCNIGDALEELINVVPTVTVIAGQEVRAPRYDSLTIYYNDRPTVIKQRWQLTIPDFNRSLTAAQIVAAAPERIPGDWLCSLKFSNGRQLQGWFASEDAGKAYLTKAATLSVVRLADVPNFTATHAVGVGPDLAAGTKIYPVRGSACIYAIVKVFRDYDLRPKK